MGWGWTSVGGEFNSLQELHNASFLNFALLDGVLGLFLLILFTQQLFEMIFVEMIQTDPSGHTT